MNDITYRNLLDSVSRDKIDQWTAQANRIYDKYVSDLKHEENKNGGITTYIESRTHFVKERVLERALIDSLNNSSPSIEDLATNP